VQKKDKKWAGRGGEEKKVGDSRRMGQTYWFGEIIIEEQERSNEQRSRPRIKKKMSKKTKNENNTTTKQKPQKDGGIGGL